MVADWWSLTQNMQERQTQVLALPARVDGSDRDTEGILGSAFLASQRETVIPEIPSASTQMLAMQMHAEDSG